jgi:uncharacterized protein
LVNYYAWFRKVANIIRLNNECEKMDRTCWVISDGRRGIEIQCIALAEALGFKPVVKRLRARLPWRYLPPQFWFKPLKSLASISDSVAPPWPNVLISCGKRCVAIAAEIRRQSEGKCFTINIQNPYIDPKNFDYVIAPIHDRLTAKNVIPTIGSLHGITPEKLTDEAKNFASLTFEKPKPIIGVLVGGNSKHHDFSEKVAYNFAEKLKSTLTQSGGSILMAPSRRTGKKNIKFFKDYFKEMPVYIWSDKDPNPYHGILGLSDYIIVTCDSVNMATEAASTGKPIYIYHFGKEKRKFIDFHASLESQGITRSFRGEKLTPWHYDSFNEIQKVAKLIKRDICEH